MTTLAGDGSASNVLGMLFEPLVIRTIHSLFPELFAEEIMWSSLRTYLQSVSPDDKGALNCLRELEGSDPEREVEDLRRQLLEAGMGGAAIGFFLRTFQCFDSAIRMDGS